MDETRITEPASDRESPAPIPESGEERAGQAERRLSEQHDKSDTRGDEITES